MSHRIGRSVEPTRGLSAARFLLATFAVSWSCGVVAGLGNLDVFAVPAWVVGAANLGFLAGPACGALAARRGTLVSATRALLEDAPSAPLRWYGVAVAAGLGAAALIAVLLVTTGSPNGALGAAGDWLMVPLVFFATTVAALPEEVGWRATLLPSWRSRVGHRSAVLGVGVVWGIWHLPLLLSDSGVNADVPLWAYPALALGLSALLAWLYDASGSSPVVTAVAHGALNAAMTPLLLASHDLGALDHLYAVGVSASIAAGSLALVLHRPRHLPRSMANREEGPEPVGST